MKLKLPKNPYKGIKVYCNKCKKDNPCCKHYDKQAYRIRLHLPGTKNGTKVKVLISKDYDNAIKEAVDFRKDMETSNYLSVAISQEGNDYSVPDAMLKYYQYLDGKHEYAHLKKEVTKGHKDEAFRFCRYFANTLKSVKDITNMRVADTSQKDVARFYTWAESHYAPVTFNKCLSGLKAFYDFLIDIEGVNIKNPFGSYISKHVDIGDIESLTKEEFRKILSTIETGNPAKVLGNGKRKTMYQPYLKDAFKLFLLTGGRREEIVDLKWSDIHISPQGIKFFMVPNLKVMRSSTSTNKSKKVFKYIPITADLNEFLLELGYDELKRTNDFILYPNREILSKTIMDSLSKAFTHYRIEAGITKDISFKNLRKTYITWVKSVMQKDTGILSSHATEAVIEKYYIDPKILSVIEKGALEIKVFGA